MLRCYYTKQNIILVIHPILCYIYKMVKMYTDKQYDMKLFEKEIDLIPLESYKGSGVPIIHECINGHHVKMTPGRILHGAGCLICSGKMKWTHEKYLSELEIRGVNYEPLETYINQNTPIKHLCGQCEHVWKTQPAHILRFHGCPLCARGVGRNNETTLYYIKIIYNNKKYYKIGITQSHIRQRFINDKDKYIVILKEQRYSNRSEAFIEEQRILKKYNHLRIKDMGFLKSGGGSELFIEDILTLDNNSS